ncbi:MAG: hypothetical protein GXO22_08685 [Aquificae bacterium]|nr:hypothetical protein [Aquificota bacterium]
MSLIEEVRELMSIIENYKKELENLDVKKDGFQSVDRHIRLSIEESEKYTSEIINDINASLSVLKKVQDNNKALLKIYGNDPLIEENNQLVKNIYDTLVNDLTKLEFQDILSQRLLKVASFMKDLEREILKIILLFGLNDNTKSEEEKRELKEKLKEIEWKKEVSQEDVDDILKEFGL